MASSSFSQYQQGHDFNNCLTYYIVKVGCCGILYPHTAFVFLTSLYGGTSVNFPITNFPIDPSFPLVMKFATNAQIPEISSIQTRILVYNKVHHGFPFVLLRNPMLQMTIFLLHIDVVLVPLVCVFCIYVALMGHFWRLFLVKD